MKTRIQTCLAAAICLLGPFGVCAEPLSKETPIEFEASSGETAAAYRGNFDVPENRSDPDSRMLSLEYVRFPATSAEAGPPIIYLSGGPGGSGIGTAEGRRFPLFMAMREFGDVIALDQRGTGASNDVETCESSEVDPDHVYLSDADYLTRQVRALEECMAFWRSQGVDPAGYNTRENVADLDALRAHLGAEKVTLWGISYGSHLAFAALNQMEDRIDRVVIASAEGLDQTIKLPARTDDYFARFGASIEHSDLPQLIRNVHAQLEETPVMLDLSNRDGDTFEFLLQKRDMQQIASAMISDPERAMLLVGMYEALHEGNSDPVAQLLSRFVRPGEPISYRLMSVAMDIASGTSSERRALIDAQAETSLLGSYLNQPAAFEDSASDLVMDETFRRDPISAVPVLLLSGSLDGRTYLESQTEAVSGLSNLEHMIVDGAGHNLFMFSPAVTERIQAFMRQ